MAVPATRPARFAPLLFLFVALFTEHSLAEPIAFKDCGKRLVAQVWTVRMHVCLIVVEGGRQGRTILG